MQPGKAGEERGRGWETLQPEHVLLYNSDMTDRDPASPKNPARIAREKRLAEALRANLRRRKQAPAPSASDDADGEWESGLQSGSDKGEGG